MTETHETQDDLLLRTQLTTFATGRDDRDWADVVARARRAYRKRVLALAAVAGVVVVGVASALVLTRPTVDFLNAKKGPYSAIVVFGSMQVRAPAGMAPGVLPHQTRRITDVEIDGKDHVLYVAPTKAGGFCYEWTRFDGGCRASRSTILDGGGLGGPHGLTVLDGTFFQANGARLVARYADGTETTVPFVWATAPINAGFYLYRVPDAHRRAGHQPTSIRLYDSDNKLITATTIDFGPEENPVSHRLPGFPPLAVPARAIWAQRTMLFDIQVAPHRHYGLWIAPERGGGTCMWSNSSSGCTPNGALLARIKRLQAKLRSEGKLKPLPASLRDFPGFEGGNPLRLCCQVGKPVSHIELRFQDGARIELTPKQHYLLEVIPPSHFPQGHRLDEMVAYNSHGNQIATRKINPHMRGLYPCTTPKNYGYGVKECP